MSGKTDKRDTQKLAGGIFTGVMVLLCAALYFFGGNTADGGTANVQAPDAQLATPRPLAALEAFVGDKAYYVEESGSEDENVSVYALQHESLSGTLALSKGSAGVWEFVLKIPFPLMPEAPKRTAGILETLLYEKRLEAFQRETALIAEEAASLLKALDAGKSLSQADLEAFLFAVDSTILDKKKNSLTFSEISVQLYSRTLNEDLFVLAASVIKTPEEQGSP